MITQSELTDRLLYDPDDGMFYWRNGPRAKQFAGSKNSAGYWEIRIKGKSYYAHRLAFLYMTGKWPDGDVDHFNGNPSDNRWVNLRPATRSQNIHNGKLPRHNKSGMKGASFCKTTQRWIAQICVNGKRIRLGYYRCPTAAHLAYCAVSTRLFGEFARTR